MYAYDSAKVDKSDAAAAVAEIAEDAAAAEAAHQEEAPASKLPKPIEKVAEPNMAFVMYLGTRCTASRY